MAEKLQDQRIPLQLTSSLNGRLSGPQDEDALRNLQTVFDGDPPIVFINGKAKANPTFNEVVDAYQQSQ